MAEKKLFR